MRFLRIFLVCFVFVYIKHTNGETCNKFQSARHGWFKECSPPCHCPPYKYRNMYCVLDEERECIGCAKPEYKGNCHCSGDKCRCEEGERYCNNYCVDRENMCDGKCEGDDRVCNGRCIRREETCDGIHCGELDWHCNGECIPQTTTCYGRSYSAEGCGDGQWNCNGVCIPEQQGCNQKCNEALGYWMCGTHCRKGGQDRWESYGIHCLTKSNTNKPHNRNTDVGTSTCPDFAWRCNGGCIPKGTPCDGKCNEAEGGWLCGASCLEEKDKNNWETDGSKCSIKAFTSGNDISENGEETTTTASNIKDSQTEVDQAKTIGISAGCGAGAVLLVGLCMFLIIYRRQKIEMETVIEANPDYGYGKFDDAITVKDYNEYYGAEEDDETNV